MINRHKHFLKSHANVQQGNKKALSISNYQKNENQNYSEYFIVAKKWKLCICPSTEDLIGEKNVGISKRE